MKTIGFILMIMQPGFVAKYDDATGSDTGVFETISECRKAVAVYYDYASGGSVTCAAVLTKGEVK